MDPIGTHWLVVHLATWPLQEGTGYKAMKLLAAAVLAAAPCCCAAPSGSGDERHHQRLFADWQRQHGKEYASPDEQARRFGVWRENHAMIEHHNAQRRHEHEMLLAHSQFSDATHGEFKSTMLAQQQQQQQQARRGAGLVDASLLQVGELPKAVDWRDPELNHAHIVGTTP